MEKLTVRQKRLKSDYQEMLNIRGTIIDWVPFSGTEPFIDAYELTINIRSVVGENQDFRDTHMIRVILPDSYPRLAAPETLMVSKPLVFHPNWFPKGAWCPGSGWTQFEGLGDFVIRMVKTLQFDPEITNTDSPANSDANHWYKSRLNSGIFPTDRQILPDPFETVREKKFIIRS